MKKISVWELSGLTKNQYYYRKRKKKNNIETKIYGRFSGKVYENTPDKLEQIKQKYKNGITAEIILELERNFLK